MSSGTIMCRSGSVSPMVDDKMSAGHVMFTISAESFLSNSSFIYPILPATKPMMTITTSDTITSKFSILPFYFATAKVVIFFK